MKKSGGAAFCCAAAGAVSACCHDSPMMLPANTPALEVNETLLLLLWRCFPYPWRLGYRIRGPSVRSENPLCRSKRRVLRCILFAVA